MTINQSGDLQTATPAGGGPVTSTPVTVTGAGTAITGTSIPTGGIGLVGWLSAIWAKLPALVGSLLPVKALLAPGIARALTTTASSADTTLTVGIKAITIYAATSDAYFALGNGAQTASSSTHYLPAGETRDYDVSTFAAPHIAVIYGPAAAATTIYLSELS